tara:strand:+ start:741 stop:1277 length:537 start_codon:yes stop_codon:yes gene_type:complete
MATNLQFIKQIDFNSSPTSSTLIVDECFNANYDNYFVNITKVDGNLAGYYLWLRFLDSSGTAITQSEYDFAGLQMTSNTTFSEVKSTNTTLINYVGFSGSGGLDDDKYDNGTSMYIYNPYDSSSYTFVTSQSSGVNSSATLYGFKTIGVHKNEETVRGIQIGGHSAFYGVKISVYGVK